MKIAVVVHGGFTEGLGSRTVIWFQGCPIRRSGCYNPNLLALQLAYQEDKHRPYQGSNNKS